MDSPERNRAFSASLPGSPIILSDPSGEAARAFGVTDAQRSLPRRWTFYIDQAGIVQAVDRNVDPDRAGPDMLKVLDRLGFGAPNEDEPGLK